MVPTLLPSLIIIPIMPFEEIVGDPPVMHIPRWLSAPYMRLFEMVGDPPLMCTASKLFAEARPMMVLFLIVAELSTIRFVGFKIVFSITLLELLPPM